MTTTASDKWDPIELLACTPPDEYDIITCLTKDDPGSFENFCSDFGYDTDSRSAEKTYKAVKAEWEKVLRVFGDGECLDDLREIV